MTIFPYLVYRETPLVSVTFEEFQVIENFKKRVEQLNETKSKDRDFPVSRTSFNDEGAVIAYENNLPDIDYILAVAARFRLLFAEKEPTRFEKVINIVLRRATDDWAKNYLSHIRACYLDTMKSNNSSAKLGMAIENRNMISHWFNSEFFHSDLNHEKKLVVINERIGKLGSLFHLYTAIRRCSTDIDRLYTVLYKFGRNHEMIYTPNHHFNKNPV